MRAWLAPGRLIRIGLVAVLVVVVGAVVVTRHGNNRKVTAYFTEAVGLYKGNDVRIRGVNVGVVDSVQQQGNDVKVVLAVNKNQQLPTNVSAFIVAPTLVSGRFVQLAPQYSSGARLPSGSSIPLTRTHIPVEWDQILDELNTLSTSLGPTGANKQGALGGLISTASKDLNGQGENLGTTINKLSSALTTLSDNRGDLFATVKNLQTFVTTLKDSDAQLTDFSTQVDQVTGVLSANRTQLAQVFQALDTSIASIRDFTANNRTELTTTLSKLDQATSTLAGQRQHIADVLQVAPGAISNFQNIFDPVSGAPTGVIAPLNGNDPSTTLCSVFTNVGLNGTGCGSLLGGLLGATSGSAAPALSSLVPTLSPLERNGACNQITAAPGPALTDVHTTTCATGSSGESTLLALLGGGKK